METTGTGSTEPLKEFLLIVFTKEFMVDINTYIKDSWDFTNKILSTSGMEYDVFKHHMWGILKAYYQHRREDLPKDFSEYLPENIRQPILTLTNMKAKGMFPLQNGHMVPMFNYRGEIANAGLIPHILAVIGQKHAMTYGDDGKLSYDSKTQELFDTLKNFSKN